MDAFFKINSYVKGSYSEKEAFEGLNAELLALEKGYSAGNRLFYLSLPPSVFAPVTSNIKECCMSKTYVVVYACYLHSGVIVHTYTHTHTHTHTHTRTHYSTHSHTVASGPASAFNVLTEALPTLVCGA